MDGIGVHVAGVTGTTAAICVGAHSASLSF